MIAKITKGSSPQALAAYLHGEGKREEHFYDEGAHGRVVASNICPVGEGEGRVWARTMSRIIKRRGKVSRPVWQVSLRNAPDDRVLSDGEWAQVARGFLFDVGAGDRPFVVVRHGVDHVHVVVSRVGFDKSLWNPRHDFRRAQVACRNAEKEHQLTQVACGWDKPERAPAKEAITQAEAALGERGKKSWKAYIRGQVDAVMKDSHVVTREGFGERLGAGRWPIRVRAGGSGDVVYTVPTRNGVRSVTGRKLGSDYQAKEITGELDRRAARRGGSVARERDHAFGTSDHARRDSSVARLSREAREVSAEINQAARSIERGIEEATLTPAEHARRENQQLRAQREQSDRRRAPAIRRQQGRDRGHGHSL